MHVSDLPKLGVIT